MRTDLPLVLALAAKANAFFRGSAGRAEVLAGHPAFAKVHDMAFIRQTGRGGEMVSESSAPWFRRLQNEGVLRVRPFLDGIRMDKGVDGAWGLLTEGDRGLEIWTATIGRRFAGHNDLQPLRLTFTAGRFDRWSLKNPMSVEDAASQLESALAGAKEFLEGGSQTVAANAVGKFLSLHEIESPEIKGELQALSQDIASCAVPLFASASRCLTLLETTGWLTATDDAARIVAEPLWSATRTALETAV